MTAEKRAKQTTINLQEKANLIWSIADKIVNVYKPHEYGEVILPMCVIKRFSDTLAPTRLAVLAKNEELSSKGILVKDGMLRKAAGDLLFYNTCKYSFEEMVNDPENLEANFRHYISSFSNNVIDIINKFDFEKEITKMANSDILFTVVQEFCGKKANMGADVVSSQDMGYIFEELIRRFSESYNETAGAHFTARDIIYLMSDLLVGEDADKLANEGITKTIYDMTMGTSQMLACMTERLNAIDSDASITCFGQELNEETFAIAKADMLIKGGNADNMKHGNTLSNDQFNGYTFDYIISNPPFGEEWKNEKKAVEDENALGEGGRFVPGLPPISDSQQLFMLNGIAKLKDTGRMAIIQNGSPLFSGDAGSGQSNIRGYLLENDWLDAIVQLPNDMFYNTGIATYIWIVSKQKSVNRLEKVQLIDASKCFEKRRKSLGNKRNELTTEYIELILKSYLEYENKIYEINGKTVESKILDRFALKYSKVVVERPLRDEKGKIILKNGKKQPDSKLKDTETIPWGIDFDEYMSKNVLPFAEDAWIDNAKTKIGYEIPFTRQFYKYVAPRKSDDILAHLKELEKQEEAMLEELRSDE